MKRPSRRASRSRRSSSTSPALLYGGAALGLGAVVYVLWKSRAASAAANPAENVRTTPVALPDGTTVHTVIGDAGAPAPIGVTVLPPATPPGTTPRPPPSRVLQSRAVVARFPDQVTAAEQRALIATMQRQLTALGFGTHGVDGVEGTDTLAAERAFFARNGLTPSPDSMDPRDRRDVLIIIDNWYRARVGLPAGALAPARG